MSYLTTYKERLSAAITWLRFPLIFFIIMLHSYSTVPLVGSHTDYFRAVYPAALWIGETGVPGFFFISGYLFFLSRKSYTEKLKTRVHTLLIPYLLWNALLLIGYLAAFAAGYPQDINYRNITDFSLTDYLRLFWDRGSWDNGNFVPLLCPFWYIRNLLIMCLLSPLLYYLIKYGRELLLMVLAAWWMTTNHNAFIQQTLLFFSLGAYFSILDINPLKLALEHKGLVVTAWLITGIADNMTHTVWGTPCNLQIHRLALICNIAALLLIADYCTRKRWSWQLLPKAAFTVFAVHYPIVVILRKLCVAHFAAASDSVHTLLYCMCVIMATALSLLVYKMMDSYMPHIKNILSGNR